MSARNATNLDVLKILAMIGLGFLGGYTGDNPAFADTPSLHSKSRRSSSPNWTSTRM